MEDITIPSGYEAKIEGNKVVFVKKDSEDEKIRKELIDILKKSYEFGGFTLNNKKDLNRYLSYFEEQKYKEKYDRMAPIYEDEESFESALDKAWKFYNDSGSSTVDGCEDNAFELAFAKGFREGFLCKESQKGPKVDIDKLRKDIYQSGYDDGYQHGKEDIQKEQNPAEWSKEDEEKIDDIIRIICTARECSQIASIGEEKGDNSDFYNRLVLFIKSLRPQPIGEID